MAAMKDWRIMKKVWDGLDEAIRRRDRAMFQQLLDAWVQATELGEARQQLTTNGGPGGLLYKVGGPFAAWAYNALWEAGASKPSATPASEVPVQPLDMAGALALMDELDALAAAKTLGQDREVDLLRLARFFLGEDHAEGLRRALAGLRVVNTTSWTLLPLEVLEFQKPSSACLDVLIASMPTSCRWASAAGPWLWEWTALKGRKGTRAQADDMARHVDDLLNRLEAHGFDLTNGGWGAEASAIVKRVEVFRKVYPKTALQAAAKEAMAEAQAQGIDVGGTYERQRM